MYHYIAIVWSASDPQATAAAVRLRHRLVGSAQSWNCIFSVSGMAVFHLPPRGKALRLYRLPNDAGMVLGRLFPMDRNSWHANWQCEFDESDAIELVRSGGSALQRRYWGRYVAFLRDAERNHQYVIRDCSGMIPCYKTRNEGVELIFSDIEDLATLDLPPFDLNLQYLAGFVHSSQLQIRECGLKNVTEILAGECLEVSEDGTRQYTLWDPREICRAHPIEDIQSAVKELQLTTQYCIDAWASTYDTILHSLSGGFDSALVLGCLSKSPVQPAFACLNRFSTNAGEDERVFARLAAARANAELLEHPWYATKRQFDDRLLAIQKSTKPTIPAVMGALDIAFRDKIANDRGAEVVWTGQGGDHLFWNLPSVLSAVDYISNRGIDFGFLSAVSDASRFSKEPYWSVLRSSWKLGRSQSTWSPEKIVNRKTYFVNYDALPHDAGDYLSHPWTANSFDLPKGKQLQIFLLAEVLHRHRPRTHISHVGEHHPLLSQPLIELCMRIPLYHLVTGGRQRALARQAFRDRIPPEILAREQKGSTASSVTDRIRRSEVFIRELLLDGTLVREKIVTRESIEPYILHSQAMRMDQLLPFLACIAAEIWVRTWMTTKLRIAA